LGTLKEANDGSQRKGEEERRELIFPEKLRNLKTKRKNPRVRAWEMKRTRGGTTFSFTKGGEKMEIGCWEGKIRFIKSHRSKGWGAGVKWEKKKQGKLQTYRAGGRSTTKFGRENLKVHSLTKRGASKRKNQKGRLRKGEKGRKGLEWVHASVPQPRT